MPIYTYKARDMTGKLVAGTIDAANKDALIEKLQKMGYIVIRVTEAVATIHLESAFEQVKKIAEEEMIVFYVQLANMISAGVSLLTSLNTIYVQMENQQLKKVIGHLVKDIESGENFSQALAKHSLVFPPLFISMIKAGEASGKLDVILERYAQYSEGQEDLRRKIQGAMLYPLILFCASMAVILFIVTFIVPQFAQIFLRAGIRLPIPTLILYQFGLWIRHFWYFLALLMIVIFLAVKFYIDTEKGRVHWDRLLLRLPILGGIYRKSAIARFSRTLATLVESGVPILQSLDIVKEVIGNKILALVIGHVREAVARGEKMSELLRMSGDFPSDTVEMISIGEETGKIDQMLNKVADFYDRSLGYTIKKLTTILEPMFLLIMGGVVAFIMISMMLPMFDMIKILKH